MAKRCGDLAEFRFKVKGPSVGKTAATKVRRKDKNLSAHYTETLTKQEDKKIRWPDLLDASAGTFYGGRKADLKGLSKKSYLDRFKEQEFMLELFVDAIKVKSTSGFLKINGYADVGDDHKTIGIPMATEMWQTQTATNPVTGAVTSSRVKNWSDPTGTAYQAGMNCGNFHLSVKDGVVKIKIKIDPKCSRKKWSRARVFQAIKKTAETFWNGSPDGYRQWVYHRDDCKRKNHCDCKLVLSSKRVYRQAGCCKVPVQIVIEDGADNPVTIHYLTPAQKQQLKTQGYVSGLRANTLNFYYPENNPHTFAHEVGHMMGFPDQYWYGIIAAGALNATGMPVPGASFAIDDDSIMGQNMRRAKILHIQAPWFFSWINAKVDTMKAIPV